MDILSFILIATGAVMVYGSKYILHFLKIDANDMKGVIFKLIGLTIALAGIFRVFGII